MEPKWNQLAARRRNRLQALLDNRFQHEWNHGGTMKARWVVVCAKCETTIQRGDTIKPQYKRAGMNPETGRPIWVRVPKAYVHAPKCPKVTPNRPGQSCDGRPVAPGAVPPHSPDENCKGHPVVDPLTGEILLPDFTPSQLTLGDVL